MTGHYLKEYMKILATCMCNPKDRWAFAVRQEGCFFWVQ